MCLSRHLNRRNIDCGTGPHRVPKKGANEEYSGMLVGLDLKKRILYLSILYLSIYIVFFIHLYIVLYPKKNQPTVHQAMAGRQKIAIENPVYQGHLQDRRGYQG